MCEGGMEGRLLNSKSCRRSSELPDLTPVSEREDIDFAAVKTMLRE